MFASTLTILANEFTSAIDNGDMLSMEELEHELDYKNDIFAFLEEKFPRQFNFTMLSEIDKEFFIDNFSDIHFVYGPSRFGIKNNGLGALLTYTIELAQRERSQLREKGFDFQLEINPNLHSRRNDRLV